jgi:hypothetical protein
MGDDARSGWGDGRPRFGIEVCGAVLCRWVVLSGELDLASVPHPRRVLGRLCQDRPPEVVLDLAGWSLWAPLVWRCSSVLMTSCALSVVD